MTYPEKGMTSADVCLVVEGSYPYHAGGVSAWTDGLVRAMPDVRFAVAHLSDGEEPPTATFELPHNVVAMTRIPVEASRPELAPDVPGRLPQADTYHALLTGWASEAAARAAARRGRPLLLSEHGLAWREAGWSRVSGPSGCNPNIGGRAQHEDPRARVARLQALAHAGYQRAQVVTAVCTATAKAQRMLGAPAQRSVVIPNCPAALPRDGSAREGNHARGPLHVGFVGRVVGIKDVLTALRAVAMLPVEVVAEFTLIGPLDHDPLYAERCQELVRSLGLAQRVRFLGAADPAPWYDRFDALLLTSVSEAQPLVLLEAMAAGLPAVATSVGGCPELLAGSTGERRIGPAGLVVPPRQPMAIAGALELLWRDPGLRRRLGANGRDRQRRHYMPAQVWGAYRALYERAAA